MSSIVIVSGCPGAGKTTLARALARSERRGLHLLSDLFYGFPVRPIDPTHPDAHHQNTVVMRALGRSARAFAEGGYFVVLDGVIGPWFLPTLRDELAGGPEVSYVVLRAPEREVLRRIRARQGPGASPATRHMANAFADIGALQAHAVDTVERTAGEIFSDVQRGLSEGRFRLGW